MTDFIAIPAIVVICWFIGMTIKTLGTSEMADRLIPVIVGLTGGVLGVIIFITNPGLIAVDNVYNAIATGIVSGLSSTGIDQIVKQLRK